MQARVKIVPAGDVVHVSVGAQGQLLDKKYASMEAATSEALELGWMLPSAKQFLDRVQRIPGVHEYEGPAEVDIAEVMKRGFTVSDG